VKRPSREIVASRSLVISNSRATLASPVLALPVSACGWLLVIVESIAVHHVGPAGTLARPPGAQWTD
jgi:hypothetical protein